MWELTIELKGGRYIHEDLHDLAGIDINIGTLTKYNEDIIKTILIVRKS